MCDHDGLDWEDIGLAGPLAEEMAEEENANENESEKGEGGGTG